MDGGEIGWLVLAIPFVPFAALLVLRALGTIQAANARPNINLSAPVWLTLVLLWILGMGVLIGHAALVYLNLHELTLSESRIYLQDLLWLELRRDLPALSLARLVALPKGQVDATLDERNCRLGVDVLWASTFFSEPLSC